MANVKLSLKDLEGAQTDLATCQRVLDTFDSVETVVHASFYKVNADYYHVCDLNYPISSRHSTQIEANTLPNRLSKNSPPSTKTPFSTSPALTWKNSPKPSAHRAHTTSA